jgi:PWWP domain
MFVGRRNTTHRQYHVRFYGDENERGWVLETAVIPFDGHETYDQLVERMVREYRRDRKSFNVPVNRRRAWDVAVSAAESAYMMPRQKRLEAWAGGSRSSSLTSDDVKTEAWSEKQEAKAAECELLTSSNEKKGSVANKQKDAKLVESVMYHSGVAKDPGVLTPPSSHIKLPKNVSNQQIAQFTVFCQKRRSSVQLENPCASDEMIESLLHDQWNRLDDETKARFIPMGSDVTHLSQMININSFEGLDSRIFSS